MKRLLVANRGEIAVRVIRTCRELGIGTVAVYSSADADALHVQLADRALCIGPPAAAQSYLAQRTLVAAAKGAACDAVHPGYGFLAENAEFADLCASQGLKFVGPSGAAIRLMGDKASARNVARQLGVPVVPGSVGAVALADASRVGNEIGYPLLLKAVAGGGGRGMRVVNERPELDAAFREASAEALAAFGDGALYMERRLARVRHVEVQVFGDGAGRAAQLGERDCSTQRRRQKLLEEAPAPDLPASLRERMLDAALTLCAGIRYEGAGTMEFIVDPDAECFYFIEMNTRIQVEHPVTEMLTGIDIVAEQLHIASGAGMSIPESGVTFRGHAIECRINAEDPESGFRPNAGVLRRFRVPGGPGVRVDTHCYPGCIVPPFYDSLLAKVITLASDRACAIERMRRALAELEIDGLSTTASFHERLLADPEFRRSAVHTTWVEDHFLSQKAEAA